VESGLDDPTTRAGMCTNAIARPISWRLLILQMHDQPDHEGLDSNLKSRTSKNQNCNQDIADEDESFIERWDSDSGLDLGVGLKSGARSCNNCLTFSLNKIQVLMTAGRRNIWRKIGILVQP
jgi:hypothetical protein